MERREGRCAEMIGMVWYGRVWFNFQGTCAGTAVVGEWKE